MSRTNTFDDSSEKYLESDIFSEGEDLRQIGQWLETKERIVDVGAGTAHTAGNLLKNESDQVLALDPSLPMLETGLQEYPSLEAMVARASYLPLAPGKIDAVVTRYAAHHFSSIETFLEEARRVLEPEGRLLVQDVAIPEKYGLNDAINEIEELRDPSHEQYYSTAAWRKYLTDAGYEIMDQEQFKIELCYSDWLDRIGTPPERREEIRQRFRSFSQDQIDRLGLSYQGEAPDRFLYNVFLCLCER